MTWAIEIEHVAGILEGEATIEPGLNAVRASNWQGKSSFVEAIKAGLGVSTALTEGQDRGGVRLQTPDRNVEVELVRENGEVSRRGAPYLGDEYATTRAELFACLDETNEIRRAVTDGENLEELLLKPLNVRDIDGQIADLKRERERVESELAGATEAKKRLPSMTEKVTRLESELATLRERHDRLTTDASERESVRTAQRDLAQARSELDRAESQVDRLEASVDRTETELTERREELEDIDVVDSGRVESDLQEARCALEELQRDVEVLQSVYSASELVLEENRLDLLTDVQRELTGDSVVCWTCGARTDRSDIEDRLTQLGERLTDLRGTLTSRQEEVERLERRLEEIEQSRSHKRDLEGEIRDLEEQLADRRHQLEEARERRQRARTRVDELAEAVDETVEEVADVESDIKYREAELAQARDELASLEKRAGRVETLSAERESLRGEIEALRDRKDRIRYETREAFDEAIEEILARFDTGFETARLTPEFDLAVARDGRRASLDALSEGELELLGFVAALAGYEAFDVAETVPIMLVDGVGALDEDNLHSLVAYLRDRAEYLVFTVYPEYAGFDGREIDPTDWVIARADDIPSDVTFDTS